MGKVWEESLTSEDHISGLKDPIMSLVGGEEALGCRHSRASSSVFFNSVQQNCRTEIGLLSSPATVKWRRRTLGEEDLPSIVYKNLEKPIQKPAFASLFAGNRALQNGFELSKVPMASNRVKVEIDEVMMLLIWGFFLPGTC
ncbi:hypothetical protein M9H77_29875 [Catharanthus roseus]|uniref:Uncharacterized protein n=1 Tax=Catharanthus roseus TaxID=4058 RepID=A0ACB9ZZW8_CATRO|nr:hypothetical protein M9H77_29875 [Catharanthus roseus]